MPVSFTPLKKITDFYLHIVKVSEESKAAD